MFDIVGNLINSVVGTVGDVVKKDQAIKEMEKQSKADLAKAKLQAKIEEQKVNSQLKIAKVQAQINHQTRVFDGDNAYDLMVLEQNKYSYMDEMLKFSIIGLDGYIIFKYGIEGLSNLPTWLQLANIMVLVSTLGGKGILRMFLNGGLKGLVKKKQ